MSGSVSDACMDAYSHLVPLLIGFIWLTCCVRFFAIGPNTAFVLHRTGRRDTFDKKETACKKEKENEEGGGYG